MGKLERVARTVEGLGALAVVLGVRVAWDDEARVQRVTLLWLPVFDRKRMEARRARKAAASDARKASANGQRK